MRRREVSGFSRKAARWIGGLAMLSLLASFWLLVRPGERSGVASVGADGYSRAAIGHSGFVRLLRDLGRPVLQMRYARDPDDFGLLVLAEPRYEEDEQLETQVIGWIEHAPATLLVLPKRRGTRDPRKQHWNDEVELLDLEDAAAPMEWLSGGVSWLWRSPKLVRASSATNWQTTSSLPAPRFPASVQLLKRDTAAMKPLVECEQGILLAKIGDAHVLSDPDLIANHGLLHGDNAALAVGIVDLLNAGGTVVFDETTHGHLREPSIWEELGRFPLALVPAHLLLLVALSLWIACGRFGRALPVPPPIGAGKTFLIDNIVALMQRGARHSLSMKRYGRMRVRAAALRLHAPAGGSHEEHLEWLRARLDDEAAQRELEALEKVVPARLRPNDAIAVARRMHRITEEKPSVTG